MKLYFNIHMISYGTYSKYHIPYILIWTKTELKSIRHAKFVHANEYSNSLKKL